MATARLLVTSQDADGQETVEVVHEALIKRWRRLGEWMAADRVFREWQERLRAALRGWEASGQDKDALLRGAQLGEAQGWFEQRAADIPQDETDFIVFSLAENRKQERRRRLLTVGVGIAAVVFMVLAVLLAFATSDRAEALADSERQRRIAVGQTLAALSALEMERSGNAELSALLAIEAMRASAADAGRVAWLADDSIV